MRLPILVAFSLVGSTAQAQMPRSTGPVGPPSTDSRGPAPGTWRDLQGARDRIDQGRAERSLNRRDTRRLKREAGQIGVLADRYGTDGLSASEQRELDTRTEVLRGLVDARRARGAGQVGKR